VLLTGGVEENVYLPGPNNTPGYVMPEWDVFAPVVWPSLGLFPSAPASGMLGPLQPEQIRPALPDMFNSPATHPRTSILSQPQQLPLKPLNQLNQEQRILGLIPPDNKDWLWWLLIAGGVVAVAYAMSKGGGAKGAPKAKPKPKPKAPAPPATGGAK